MKKIAIVMSLFIVGGIEAALIDMLRVIDYSKYEVTLFSYFDNNPYLSELPEEVKRVELKDRSFADFVLSYFKKGRILRAAQLCSKYLFGTIFFRENKRYEFLFKNCMLSEENYDVVIAYRMHYVSLCMALFQIKAKKKVFWIHGLFDMDESFKSWITKFDHIFGVSELVVDQHSRMIPEIKDRISVFYNIIDDQRIRSKANTSIKSANSEMMQRASIKVLSVGRFASEKNFDSIPYFVRELLDNGVSICWYLIGYGGEEEKIREQIRKYGVENNVIILGKKVNPYPYMAACDVYIQPSLHEGRSVAVIEAQILGKPVIITNYATAEAQLHNGIDGLIVPLEKEACAKALVKILQDKERLQRVAEGTKQFDYCNKNEIQKLYKLIEE